MGKKETATGETPVPLFKTVFTIHNIAFQGIFPAKAFALTNLSKEFFTPAALEFYSRLNLMKGGILFADALTTVSRTYAKEIQTPAGGFGLDGVLQMRVRELHGILNGVDYAHWNPATNGYLKQRYSPDDLSGKQACKTDLLERMGIDGSRFGEEGEKTGRRTGETPVPRDEAGERRARRSRPTHDEERPLAASAFNTPPLHHSMPPLLGFVSRLTEQKGVEVLADAIEDLVGAGAVLAILGKGERKYEEMLLAAARRFPGQVAVKIAHDEELAHRIQAGADMLLVPSRFEPCGLTQLYALKYGTIPVVRATGGLEDTVTQHDERTGQGTGFKFALYKSEALVEAVRRAILLYNQPEKWQKLMRTAMACDFSWQASAKEYEKLYAAL
jgi:starch synthase